MELREDIRDYWNLRSEGFSESVMDEVGRHGESFAERVLGLTDAVGGSKILDVGCGPGFFSLVLSSHGMSVTGIDYSENMVSEARRNAADSGIDTVFMQMDAHHLEFEDGTFDMIVSRNVLWNLTDPVKAYSEMIRVLKPSGRLYISDGNFYLHHHNTGYLRAHQDLLKGTEKLSENGHAKFNRGKVDFSIIDRLADELPLSREERPFWDLRVLTDLGCSSVNIQYPAGHRMQTYDGHRIIHGFEIIARKGE